MDPLSTAASIIAILQLSESVLSSCYRFVGKVNDAASDVDRIIREVGYLTAILDDLKSLVSEDSGSSASRMNALAGDQGPLAMCVKCLEELKSKLSREAGPMSFRRRLQWPFDSKKVDDILDKIQRQIPILELALLGDNVAMTKEIKSSLEDAKRLEERERVLNWLRCADPTVKHQASRRLYQPGSNHWVLESDSFKEWKQTPGQALWLHGIPGAGKTIICSTIIDHVEELCKSQPESRVAYYYFDFSDQSIQKLGYLLRCLMWQLCRHDNYLSNHAWSLYVSCDNGRQEPGDEALSSTLFAILNESQQSYVIIDALDECPLEGREQLRELVIDRIEGQPGSYNFLFTSRKELDIEQTMTELGRKIKLHNVPILAGDVNADVRLHVRQFIANNRTLKDWSQGLRAETEDAIANGAQGMFRWAACQLDLIKNCRQAGAVRKILKNLPRTLDDVYDRILSSIPDETWQIARSALMLLTYSIRPLTLQELAEAMVVDFEKQDFDPNEHRLTNYRHVLEICSSLVSVSLTEIRPYEIQWMKEKTGIERKHFISHKTEIELVQFAHLSVKEYMMLERAKVNANISRFCFSSDTAHRSIAELSLVYLIEFSGGARLNLIDFDAFPFLAYAAQMWPEHWRNQLALKDQETINSLIRRILDSDTDHNSYINYLNICKPDLLVDPTYSSTFTFTSETRKSLDSLPQPLYYTAQLGHYELCEWLIRERNCDVNSTRGIFGQPVQIASRFGHGKVVQLLVDHGAELNTICGKYGYPLQAAAYGGHVDVVRILLDHGADVNAEGGEFGSALIAACHEGHLQVARVLLDRGADMDMVCVYKGKALNIAAGAGNIPLVRLLLQKGADINDTCDGAGSALYAASLNGALDMVKMLVFAGADVNLRSGSMCTALQAACSQNHQRSENELQGKDYFGVAKFLLKSGADVNIHGGEYGDALQAAIEGTARGNVIDNNIDIVNLLLNHGADVNYKGGKYRSAMQTTVYCGNIPAAHALLDRGVEIDDEIFLLAVENRRKTVIPLLLEKGVDVNAENKKGTVLQIAIKEDDHDTTAALLKDPKIDINALGGTGGETALYCAVNARNQEVVKLLLNRGANINEPCGDGSYCLPNAVVRQDVEMVELLLQRGAFVNASHLGRETALIAACDKENECLVRLLLSHDADVNLWVPDQGDALQCACFRGNEDLAKLLLQHGADVKAPEGRNGSCLECAIIAKRPGLIRLLLDAGANVNFSRPIEDLEEGNIGFGGPLSGSIWCKQDGLLSLLIDRGADVNARGRRFYGNPLQEAVRRNDEEAFRILLDKGANVNQLGGHNGCALVDAILDVRQNDKYVQLLLEAGADVNLEGGHYGCPLAAAVHKSNLNVVEKLLDLGADINAPAGDFGSALQIAVGEGDLEVFRLLLNRGADVNVQGGYQGSAVSTAALGHNTILKELLEHGADAAIGGSAALVFAAMCANNEAISILLDHGADLHCQEGVPGKALHVAAKKGHISTVKLLLDRGADVNAFGGEYGNALMAIMGDYFAHRENKVGPMANFLLERGASVNLPPSEEYTSALHAAISQLNTQFVDRLLEAGADVNAHDPRFGTALTAAAFWGDVDTMNKLLERGANLTLTGEKYGAPLQAAAHRHRLAALKFLLEHGVDVNQCSGKTGYALHAACLQEDAGKVIELLLDHGADPNARGGEYESALQAAAVHGHLENVKLLLDCGADPTIEGGRYGSPLNSALAGEEKHYHVANFLRRHLQKLRAGAVDGAA